MKEAEVNRDVARFCTNDQCVSLQAQGLDLQPAAPVSPGILRHVQTILALMVMTMFFSLLALFVVASQPWRPEKNEDLSVKAQHEGANYTEEDPDTHPHFGRDAEMQEATQRVMNYVENSSSLHKEIQMLKYRMDNVSSQVQLLRGHLEDASADIQQTKGVLKGSGALALETQALRNSLELASADIHSLKGDLKKTNAMTSQTQGLLKSSMENTSAELHMLGRGLEEAQSEIQALRGSLQSSTELSSQTRSFLQSSVNNTSAEIQAVRDRLARAGDEMKSLKKDLETVTAQTQKTNGHLEQTDAQIQMLTAELKSTRSLHSKTEEVSRETQTIRRSMADVSVLKSKVQELQSSLEKAKAETQSLKTDLETTKALAAKIQKEQSRLGALQSSAVAAREQEQQAQNQLLQLILQGWKAFQGSLYYFSQDEKSWHEAEKFCVTQGAHLASVTSEVEQAFLTQSTSTAYHWIGLTDRGTEGDWRWVDGTPFDRTLSNGFWAKNQPDNWRHKNGEYEDCVHTQKQWNDMKCGATYRWVCKKSTGQATASMGQS
ncbi:C-type lectin domain family 4 member F isoform X1 [Meriones unguiculatus]|uniref:C-type lectin domain family 4 member F isoform X1 n=1 Tax=Meriones unguiculatus TaxID=10047 RepID=UPI000B4EF3DB|nr:C-type lectin domain family 4 member F isoform X1 [Meriones unguiculatus]